MSPLTTHVLDTARGLPARDLGVTLEKLDAGSWKELTKGMTDGDGRCRELLPSGALEPATYRLTFDTESYFKASGVTGFYPHVAVVFTVRESTAHLHVPLLLSPYGYSTYRGS